jgi:hypothetical protein
MKTLKTLAMTVSLLLVVASTAFADCPTPVPGEMQTPPCTSTLITPDDPFTPGETSTPSQTADDVVTISETAMSFLLSALPLF